MSEAKKLVVIAAGGTGGHMFPAQAFAEEMARRGWRVGLITDERGERYAKHFPADWREHVQAATIGSKRPDKLISSALKINAGIAEAKARFKDLQPDVVAGFGGYPSFPSLAAARSRHVPIIIHEQNAVLGRVNRAYAGAAKYVACGFERLDRLPKKAESAKRVVGNPVRAPILPVRDMPYPTPSEDGPLNLLVTGGSQGAKLFGEVIPAAVARLELDLRQRLTVVQQVREEQLDEVRAQYETAHVNCEIASFFSDMPEKLAAAQLVLARAGASTVTELAATGRPSILIPLAIAMDDHQTANAEGLAAMGAADVIPETDFTVEEVTRMLAARLSNGQDLTERAAAAKAQGRIDAAQVLADLAEEAAGVSRKKS
ncbi:MAG: undecaprenyldiphospho-muramoylpentapeptide beta-N-acetylglucosaminyltransferase [Pseudomonadota bacterium]